MYLYTCLDAQSLAHNELQLPGFQVPPYLRTHNQGCREMRRTQQIQSILHKCSESVAGKPDAHQLCLIMKTLKLRSRASVHISCTFTSCPRCMLRHLLRISIRKSTINTQIVSETRAYFNKSSPVTLAGSAHCSKASPF